MDAKWEGTGSYTTRQLYEMYSELEREVKWRILGEEANAKTRCKEALTRLKRMEQETDDEQTRQLISSLSHHTGLLMNEQAIISSGRQAEEIVGQRLDTLDISHIRFDNAGLGLGDQQEEYDHLIIANKAVFIVETKWRSQCYYISRHGSLKAQERADGYNLMYHLDEKRHLLRRVLMKALGKKGETIPIIRFLVFANSQASVVDKSKVIQWYFSGELVYRIEKTVEEFSDCPNLPMKRIAQAVKAFARPTLVMPKLDMAALRAELDYLFPETTHPIEDEPHLKGLGDRLVGALKAPKRALISLLSA